MSRSPEMQEFFRRSGSFETDNQLVSFLYELMRDHLTPGIVEGIVSASPPGRATLTNGWLAKYAKDVARRLQGG